MKPGRRALGIAESYRGTDDEDATSTLGGALVRVDRTVDDFVFGTCTVGGTDATDAVIDCWRRLDREDVAVLFLAGVAPAWYNVVDLGRVASAVDRPVVAVSYEDSGGLTDAIEAAFDPPERDRRLEVYEGLPDRRRLDDGLYVRSVGTDDATADRAVAAFTHDRRPEPLRVAKRAARRVDAFRRD